MGLDINLRCDETASKKYKIPIKGTPIDTTGLYPPFFSIAAEANPAFAE
jgi:hypothetical protein